MPEGLDAVIERAVAKDPADRYPSAGELIDAAREREGAALAATRVLSTPRRPTAATADRGRRGWAGSGPRWAGSARWRCSRRCGVAAAAVLAPRRRGRHGLRRRSRSAGRRCGSRRVRGSDLGVERRRRDADPDRPRKRPVVDDERRSGPGSPASPSAPARSGSPIRRRARSCGSTRERRGSGRRIGRGRRNPPRADRLRRRPDLGRRHRRRRDQRRSTPAAAASKPAASARAGAARLAAGAGGVWVTSAATGTVRRIGLGRSTPARRSGRPRPHRGHGRRRPRLGRQQPLRTVSTVDAATAGRRPPDPGRRPAGRDRRRHQTVWVASCRRGRRRPHRHFERRDGGRPDRASAPNPARSRSAAARSGWPTTATAR